MDQQDLPQSDEQWQQQLNQEQYRILRQKGTEPAFTGAYWDCKKAGVYRCAGCGTELFNADSKYDSGSGWPSFTEPMDDEAIAESNDDSLAMRRTEVLCKKCGGHLGHVFPDGPGPTGMRYCINSGALSLDEDASADHSSPEGFSEGAEAGGA